MPKGVSIEEIRGLAERAGFRLTERDASALKPMWDHYAALIDSLWEVSVDEDDPAVVYAPRLGGLEERRP